MRMSIKSVMLYKEVYFYRAHQRPANQELSKHDANSRYSFLVNALFAWKIGLVKFP